MKFDLSVVPSGKTLTSVRLYLYCTYADANPSVEIYVHETGDSWSESTITCNNVPAVGSFIEQRFGGLSRKLLEVVDTKMLHVSMPEGTWIDTPRAYTGKRQRKRITQNNRQQNIMGRPHIQLYCSQ